MQTQTFTISKDLKKPTGFFPEGKIYEPKLCPPDIKKGPVGTCYDTCAVNALDGKYGYVEGYAKKPLTDEWIMHAWLTDGEHAFDPTWKSFYAGVEIPVPTLYVGTEMDIRLVAKFMLKTGYAGVFANKKRSLKLATMCIESMANSRGGHKLNESTFMNEDKEHVEHTETTTTHTEQKPAEPQEVEHTEHTEHTETTTEKPKEDEQQ